MRFSFSFDPEDHVAYACLWSLVHPQSGILLERVWNGVRDGLRDAPFEEGAFYRSLRECLVQSYRAEAPSADDDVVLVTTDDFAVMFGKLFCVELSKGTFRDMESRAIQHMMGCSPGAFFKRHHVAPGCFLNAFSRIYPATFRRVSSLADEMARASMDALVERI